MTLAMPHASYLGACRRDGPERARSAHHPGVSSRPRGQCRSAAHGSSAFGTGTVTLEGDNHTLDMVGAQASANIHDATVPGGEIRGWLAGNPS